HPPLEPAGGAGVPSEGRGEPRPAPPGHEAAALPGGGRARGRPHDAPLPPDGPGGGRDPQDDRGRPLRPRGAGPAHRRRGARQGGAQGVLPPGSLASIARTSWRRTSPGRSAMSVRIVPWQKGQKSGFEVDIRITWPEGGKYRARLKSPLSGREATRRWGIARE